MIVRRIVSNILSENPDQIAGFYARVLDLDILMDLSFIQTLGHQNATQPVLLSVASEGGADTPLPALSIEVDDLEEVLERLKAENIEPCYGPVLEDWGARRFYFRDPTGTLVNVLTHAS